MAIREEIMETREGAMEIREGAMEIHGELLVEEDAIRIKNILVSQQNSVAVQRTNKNTPFFSLLKNGTNALQGKGNVIIGIAIQKNSPLMGQADH